MELCKEVVFLWDLAEFNKAKIKINCYCRDEIAITLWKHMPGEKNNPFGIKNLKFYFQDPWKEILIHNSKLIMPFIAVCVGSTTENFICNIGKSDF